MFGLGREKKKGKGAIKFDLETDFQDPQKQKELRKKATENMRKAQSITMGGGGGKENVRQIMLDGYTALMKVMDRMSGLPPS